MWGKRAWVVATCLALPLLAEVRTVGPSFIPDATFKAANLNGWRTLGQANWKMENGELVGKAAEGSSGWLMLDHSYQDVAFYGLFRCADACDVAFSEPHGSAIAERGRGRHSGLHRRQALLVPSR